MQTVGCVTMPEQLTNIEPSEFARKFEETERQRALWEALTQLIKQKGGWTVSPQPGKRLRFECLPANKTITANLESVGYRVTFVGNRQRTGSDGLFEVHQYEIGLPK